MRAIEISKENVPEIIESVPVINEMTHGSKTVLEFYLDRTQTTYYLVVGFITARGRYIEWTVFPRYLFDKNFDYDPIKIKTEWNQIVRL